MRGSRTGRPVMALLDLLGRRLALRVLWELRDEGPMTFRELQHRCGDASSSTLNQRLAEFTDLGIVEHVDGYRLTARGRELGGILLGIRSWADRWAAEIGADDH